MNRERARILRLGARLGIVPGELLAWAREAEAWLAEGPAPPKPKRGEWTPERRQRMRESLAARRAAGHDPRRKPPAIGARSPEPEIIEPGAGRVELFTAPAEPPPAPPALAAPARPETLYDVLHWRKVQGDRVEELAGRRYRVNGSRTELTLEQLVQRSGHLRGKPFDLAAIRAALPENRTEAAE